MRNKTKKIVKKKFSRKPKEKFSGELKAEEKEDQVVPVNALAVHNAWMYEFQRMNNRFDRLLYGKEYVVHCECGRVLQITV